jgi:4-azaleucine resistance transporter AzlC
MNKPVGNIIRMAFQDSLPIFLGYLPVAFVFGVLTLQHGFPWYLAPLMSLFQYTGTTQFIAIGLIEMHSSLLLLFSTIVIIDVRNSFYSLSVASRFPKAWPRKWYLTHGLTDETYSILTSRPSLGADDPAYCFYITALNHSYWVGSTLLGVWFGSYVSMTIPALDFVLPSLFLVLLSEQWRAAESNYPFVVALAAGLACMAFAGSKMLLPALAISATALFLRKDSSCAT